MNLNWIKECNESGISCAFDLYFWLLTCKISFWFSSFLQKHQQIKYHRIIETKSIYLSSKERKKNVVLLNDFYNNSYFHMCFHYSFRTTFLREFLIVVMVWLLLKYSVINLVWLMMIIADIYIYFSVPDTRLCNLHLYYVSPHINSASSVILSLFTLHMQKVLISRSNSVPSSYYHFWHFTPPYLVACHLLLIVRILPLFLHN